MIQKHSWLVIMLLASTQIYAGGFQLNTQGVKALGMGASTSAYAKDASSVFFNPGAVANLKQKYVVSAGGVAILPKVYYQTAATVNGEQTSPIGTPIQFYVAGKANDKLSLGLSVNNQFGSTSSFESDWEGKYIVQKSSLKTFMFQPTISYKVHSKVSLGVGFVYTTGGFELEKGIPAATATTDGGQASLVGSGSGVGYNIGSLIKLVESTDKVFNIDMSLTYRSPIQLNLTNGTATFTDISVALKDKFPNETAFIGGLKLPGVFSGGFWMEKELSEKVVLGMSLEYNRTFWSSYDTLKINFDNAETPDVASPKEWTDVNAFRFGLEAAINQKLFVRAGTYYDQSPIQDGFVSPELPDKSHMGLTLGLGVNVTDNLAIDLAFLGSSLERSASLDEAGWEATYRRNVKVFGFGITYQIPTKE